MIIHQYRHHITIFILTAFTITHCQQQLPTAALKLSTNSNPTSTTQAQRILLSHHAFILSAQIYPCLALTMASTADHTIDTLSGCQSVIHFQQLSLLLLVSFFVESLINDTQYLLFLVLHGRQSFFTVRRTSTEEKCSVCFLDWLFIF